MYKKLLDYNIFSGTKKNVLDEILVRDRVNIISGNPEVLYNGLINNLLHESFNEKDALIIPDGIGTIIASKLYGNKIDEKIAGIEVMDMILNYCKNNKKPVYLLGANEEVINKCKKNIQVKYKGLEIAGYHNGYFDMNNCNELIESINNSSPFAIFVAMGAPRQEIFIQKYKEYLPCKIFMGVGGSFDVIAGNVNRAPKWMINFGLEWLYRVAKEPWRIKRLGAIPRFIFISWKNRQ